MKKVILTATIILLAATSAFSQNIQLHYDFGSLIYQKGDKQQKGTRGCIITTVEMFKPDSWGSTFFFVDMNYGESKSAYGTKQRGVLGAYWEISRELKFWKAPVSAHIEYNGGLDKFNGSYNQAVLLGATYTYASKDFTKIFSLTAAYKVIPLNPSFKNVGKYQPHSVQLTAVWNVSLWKNRILLSGFAKTWLENKAYFNNSKYVFLSQPQIWYNLNTIKGLEKFNLSLGSEVELSSNLRAKGFVAIPTLAMKWTF